jgi:hypothetical protein
MNNARRDGLYLLLLGSLVFLLLGAVLARTAPAAMVDFRVLYQPARCLIAHGDPYNENDVLRISLAEGLNRPSDNDKVRRDVTQNIYPPTAFPFTVPFALLPWEAARILWMMLTVGSLVCASILIWSLGANHAPVLAGLLVGFLLANSEMLVITGNIAGIAISLCVVAVWCFLSDRYIVWGVLCLGVSLAIKPHDTGLIWLYFLLAGGVYRKRAWQSLLVMVLFGLPAVLWVWHVAPDWLQEMHTHLLAGSVHGGLNDPGMDSTGAHGLGMMVCLQAIFGVFWDDPRIYNTASYLAFAPLLLVWAWYTLKSMRTPARTWLAIAAMAALSLLPVYHRQQDTKLLLLTLPACTMLWAEGGLTGWVAVLVTSAGLFLTGDLPWAVFLGSAHMLHLAAGGIVGKLLVGVELFTAPLILLIVGIFYLVVYARRCSAHPAPTAK